MKPIISFLDSIVDKYIGHIPEEKKKQFRDDAIDAAKALVEAAVKGAAEGMTGNAEGVHGPH